MPTEHTSLASYPAGVLIPEARIFEQLTILSGPSGAGKTTWCQNAALQGEAAALPVAGLISPAILEHGQKVGIAVVDLKSGERRVLATRRQSEQEDGCRWCFNPETIEWANRCLQKISPRDILFIDELGSLELIRSQGFIEAMKLIDEDCCSQAFVVVRPSLLQLARDRWPGAHLLQLRSRLP